MSETSRLSKRNNLIQDMMLDGEKIKNFYRFTAQNPHINLHDACQILINRPNATICYSYDEWNSEDLQRRIIAGRKGIPYYDADGNRRYVFDVSDTHGKEHYKRNVYPMGRLLKGLKALTDADMDEVESDYQKIQVGVVEYLSQNGVFSEEDEYQNRLMIEGLTYSLYSKTGSPDNTEIHLHGMVYSLKENSDLFKEIHGSAQLLLGEIEEAYEQSLKEPPIVDDTEEETVSDEPIIPFKEPEYVKIHAAAQSNYKGYLVLVHYTDLEKVPPPEEIYLGKAENYEIGKYDDSDHSLVFISNNPKMFSLLRGDGYVMTQQEMVEKGLFSEEDYKEFYDLQNGLLKDFEKKLDIKFGMTVNDEESGVPFRYPDWQDKPKQETYKNPLYRAYAEAQEEFPKAVVILRVGDFYEIMGENAKVISDELDLTLTGRDVGLADRVPMVGFPYHAADRYVEKLLEQHSVVVVEQGEEPKYILSHAEMREPPKEKPYLIEVSEEESEALGNVFEEDEPAEFYADENEAEYAEADEEADEYEEEEEVEEKPQPQEKKGKPLSERKRKEKPQISLFDFIDNNTDEQTPYERLKEQMIERQLKYGSGVQHGKFRIYEKYLSNPTETEFATFLKKEYGLGGFGRTDGDSQHHDGKGIKMAWRNEKGEREVEAFLKWNEVATRVADLIDDGNYLTFKEKEEYAVIEAKRAARTGASTDKERLKVIARQFIAEETKWTWNGKAELRPYKYEESAYFVKEHREELAEILQAEQEVKSVSIPTLAYLDGIDVEFYPEYCPRVEKVTQAEETPEQKKIRGIAKDIIDDGTNNTETLSWMSYFDEFDEDEQFVIEHKDEIAEYLSKQKEVADVNVYEDGFSLVFYADYCAYGDEIIQKSEEANASVETSPANTDLNEIGFDQSELGGAKARFRGNIEAIRLMERLYVENREPTNKEKLTLAKYVGWGGLAKAFDEHDENWQKEYKELKEMLSTDDYENARASVLSAYYTPKEVIGNMYSALEKFGVKGNNRILEPAMGTGNFFGYMPQTIAENAKLYGVELDEITGKIATKLYPNANVQIKGFEQTTFPNNHFDIVVGNVPFGNFGVFDSDYAKENFYIHEYFLAKSVDKLKPNGIMAVITSARTMDKRNQSLRKYVADRAELIGAIRLPNTAFKQIAGTEVVADVLFFQKRPEKIYADSENTEWLSAKEIQDGYYVNEYFHNHPEMVLGTFKEEVGMYGAKDLTVIPDGRDLNTAMNDAIALLPANIYTNPEYSAEEEQQLIEVDYNVKPLCYKAENGKLYMRIGEAMVEQEIPKHPQDAYERIRGMIELRNQLRHVLEIQSSGCSDEKLAEEQGILNTNYDRFVKKYGYINGSTNKRLFKEDGDSALLFACENYSDEKKTATKADVFTKRTIRPYVAPTSTSDCFEALQISQNERGQVDISYIEELTDKDYDTVITELGDTIYRNPMNVNPEDKYSGFEMAEDYLSGKVVSKLQTAKRFANEFPDMGYERNVTALEQVQPAPIPASDISVKIGTNWIDKQYYAQFLFELLGLPRYYYPDGITIFYNNFDSSWRVDVGSHLRNLSSMNVKSVYGTKDANAYRLFEDALNSRATTIYDTIEENGKEKRVVNQHKTIAAREKQNKIQESFKEWIFKDPERREDLEKTYNAKFNQIRLPKYDGSYLKFPEMNPLIELRPHQRNAVHRIITSGNTMLHHSVGTGKTYTITAAAVKLRQYGLAKKPMIVVPNHLVEQWGDSFRTLYPNANILVAHKEDLTKENREKFVSRVAMGDWDSIIIAQSSFAKIPISQERQIRKINEEIYKIDQTIAHLWENSERPHGAVKNLERIKKNRAKTLKKLMDDSKKDNVFIFEKLGVDYLFVDEAHAYKNLSLFTKMNNVSGISNAASGRASDMQLKCEYINELHGGDKGVVFATGTPISNSMAEMYTLQTYLQNQTLQETGITFFDGWASNFGETVTALEMSPSGRGYKAKTRFAKFTNLPELLTMYHSFADVQTADMVKLDTPTVDKKVITLKPSETVLRLADEIAERAERIHQGGVDVHIDNMLKVTSDGKKVALDPRVYDRACEDEHESKVNECVERVHEIWERTKDNKGVQLIFCDLSTPKKAFKDYEYEKDFDVYNDIKHKLVARGIPEEEIAFIHDANSDKQKMELYQNVNAGNVRVFIGSTEKCGAGMNVQQRLFALHHLDTPYRPLDLQQREGRIVRQGNSYKNVEIYTYVTERTFDSYSYQILENKQRFISQIERGDMTMREAEDIDETTLSYAEIKAITAANPKIKRKMEVDTEIQRLRVLESEYRKSLYTTQDNVRKHFPEEIRRQTMYLENLQKDIETVKTNFNPDAEQFKINVLGKEYTDKTEGGRALMEALHSHRPETVVAEYSGFKISLNPLSMLQEERSVTLTGAGQYRMEIGESEIGLLRRLSNFMSEFADREAGVVNKLAQLENNLKIAQEQLDVPFEHVDELEQLLKEQAELNAELDLNRREEVVIEETDGDENDDDLYMGVPTEEVEKQPQRKKARKSFGKSQLAAYEKQKEKTPDAYVFIRNGDKYEIVGDYTQQLGGTLEQGEHMVTSFEEDELDTAIRTLVDEGGVVKIVDEYEEIKEPEIFIDERDTVATMEIEFMPDYRITQEEMHERGYQWDGMLPLRTNTARRLKELGLTVYVLDSNDTESEWDGTISEENVMYGIEKPDWKEFIESERGQAYLSARLAMCNAAIQVINEELFYVDETFTISFTENNIQEKTYLEEYLVGREKPDIEEQRKWIPNLLAEFTSRIYNDGLLHYGWNEQDVSSSLADNLEPDELLEEANKTYEFWRLRDYMHDGILLYELSETLGEEKIGEITDEEKARKIAEALREHFRRSDWAGDTEADEYDKWYDGFMKSDVVPMLMGEHYLDIDKEIDKIMDEMTVEEAEEFLGVEPTEPLVIDYQKEVEKAIVEEFSTFRDGMLKLEAEQIIQNNYQIYVKMELFETILSNELEKEYYQALYQDKEKGILEQLYNDFLEREYASVNSMQDTKEFIESYCEQEHKEIIYGAEKKEPTDENVVFFGNNGGTAYYYFKDKLSLDNATPRIQEEADEYVIAAPVCYLSQEYMEEHNITFLKTGRDVDEEKLFAGSDYKARREMERACNMKYPMEATLLNNECKREIERYIRNNFDGMHLRMDGFIELVDFYGEERMKYVLANTVQLGDEDGRYSPANKAWAQGININNSAEDRASFNVYSHPALLDGLVTHVRKKEQEKAVEAQPQEKKQAKKEEEKMPQNEKPKREWEHIKVSQNALIKRFEKHSFMRMPSGEYEDYTYNVYNDRIKGSTQITDLQSDSRELCYDMRFDKNDMIVLKHKDNAEVELSFDEFKDIVNGSTNADYPIRSTEEGETRWFTTNVPKDAVVNMGEKSTSFRFPNETGLEKYTFYIPNSFVRADEKSEEGRMEISAPSDLRITAKSKDGESMQLTPYQLVTLMHNTKSEQYVRQGTKTEYQESQAKVKTPSSESNGWKYVSVHESAKIAEYDDSTLFRMPTSGEYNGYAYFIPNNLLKANAENATIRIALPDGFIVKAQNNRVEKEEEKNVEMGAEDFIAHVKGKGEADYERYHKPSAETRSMQFLENEKRLIESVPQEMKDKPNWVAIKSWYNAEKGKVEKRPIDCNTDEYADSVNPATWTTFDKARGFAKEKGYTTLGYALDGKDGICCIDLDHCLNEEGRYTDLAKEVMIKCGKTYMEKSMSGKGLHVFGKTAGMDVRTFSKDGDMEFYQTGRFISMTGDGTAYSELESFDTYAMKELIKEKCEPRVELRGQGQGVEGLSMMDDREVVEKACADKKHGATFKALYDGQDLRNNHSNSDMSLMNRLAFWCNGDKEQMLRIFATSGLYRPEKSDGYYEGTSLKAVRDTIGRYNAPSQSAPSVPKHVNSAGKDGK